MPGYLKVSVIAVSVLLVGLAGLAAWAVPRTLPPEPHLAGHIERGALVHGGRKRSWITYVPERPHAHPPLLIVLHASMGSAASARQAFGYDFDLLAEEQGFVVVYPHGYGGDWNDANVKGPFAAKRENVDDVGFLHALADRLVTDHDVDRAHVYVVGVSNGGGMTIRLALETPAFARAYAAVIAHVPAPVNMSITPVGQAVSMLLMNGTADPMGPWDGGDIAFYGVLSNRGRALSVQAGIDYFLKINGLGGAPEDTKIPDIDTTDGSTAERFSWSAPGKRSVTLIRIQGGGHGVPHPATYGPRGLGRSNRDFHAAREIWEFFQKTP